MEENTGRRVWNSTLKRRKPIESKVKNGIKRSGWIRSKTPKTKEGYQHEAKRTGQKGKGLKQISKKHKRALVKNYFPAQNAFLKLTENRFCWICLARSMNATRSEVRKIMLLPFEESTRLLLACGATANPAVEVHHWAGRIGRLLDFVPYFIPECRECQRWPHTAYKEARRLDLLAPAAQYNVFPVEMAERLAEEYATRI